MLPEEFGLNIQKTILEAVKHHEAGRFEKADAIYRRILQKEPLHADALHLSGLIAHQTGKHDVAIDLLERLIKANPNIAEYLNSCGAAYAAAKKFDLAFDCFKKATTINPNQAHAHNNMGNVLKESGQFEEAVPCYQKALEISPDYVDAYKNLAKVFKKLGRLEDAISNYNSGLRIAPDDTELHIQKGIALEDLDKNNDAIKSYKKALTINPELAKAHHHMGFVNKKLGFMEDAIECYEKALSINPTYAEAHNNLGNLYKDMACDENAIECYEKALAIKPDFIEAQNNLGVLFRNTGHYKKAIECYEKALSINSDFYEAHHNMGCALIELGNSHEQEVLACFEKALKINPDFVESHYSAGNTLKNMHRKKEAIAHYEHILRLNPSHAKAQRQLMDIAPNPDHIPIIEGQIKKLTCSEDDLIEHHFTLGDLYAKEKSYIKSFEHYSAGNAFKKKSSHHDAKYFSIYTNKLIEVYTKEYFENLHAYGSDSYLPVFIVGMPRSGTSLVEQILSSHPNIYGAGELTTIEEIKAEIINEINHSAPYPECMLLFKSAGIYKYANRYLKQLRKHSASAKFITDKMPGNFFNIGIIKMLFPHARIIHCIRDPIDTCLSNFISNFSSGNEFSFNLVDLGKYYLDYQRLAIHWRNVFSTNIFDIQYEKLVSNQEEVSKELINYIGLEWDERCLDFHENDRTVRTASHLQVRKPMYQNSVNRWKRYEEQLQPLIEILQESSRLEDGLNNK